MKISYVFVLFVFIFADARGDGFWSRRSLKSKIYNGREARPNSFPYQVELMISPDVTSNRVIYCGGSLITRRYVLTAAHCVDTAQRVLVLLGAHNITNKNEPTQVRYNASSVTVHPDWDNDTVVNDIALVQLPEYVTLNRVIQTVTLPNTINDRNAFIGRYVVISGWGVINDNETTLSPVLLYALQRVINDNVCNETFNGIVRSTEICTRGVRESSACSGDSGSALILYPTTFDILLGSPFFQIGIVSYGTASCEQDYPQTYTRVASYIDWIRSNSDL